MTATQTDTDDSPSRLKEEAEAVAGDSTHDAPLISPEGSSRSGFPDADGTLELSVTTIEYTTRTTPDGQQERPIIHVFGRTENGKPEHIKVHGFLPYLYIPEHRIHDLKDDSRVIDIDRAREIDKQYLKDTTVARAYTQTPKQVSNLREKFEDEETNTQEHYEADIRFGNRFRLDKGIKTGIRVPKRRDGEDGPIIVHESEVESVTTDFNPRIHFFDIETEDRNGFPEDGEQPIICLTSYDNYSEQYIVWLYRDEDAGVADVTDLDGYEFLEDRDEYNLRVNQFSEEEEMLQAYCSYLKNTDPGIITGWNAPDFDVNYLIDRLKKLDYSSNKDLDPDNLARIGDAYSSYYGGTIQGRVVMDLLKAYKRTKFTELDSYKLEAVGQTELDAGKERYSGDLGDLWEQDTEKLLEYNLRDVELCVELDKQLSIFRFWGSTLRFAGCNISDAPIPGDAVDMYVLHSLNDRYILPSKGMVEAEDYEGGAVFDPISGVEENVTVLDLKSLYPMSMWTINASPETKVDPEEYDGETYVAPNGVHFQKEPEGVIVEIIKETLDERDHRKSLRDEYKPGDPEYEKYDRQQASVKVLMNSLYGVLGWERFRLYDAEMGAAVTSTGREVIDFTEDVVEDNGLSVTYGDTDSVMISLDSDLDKEECIERSFELEDEINERYDEFAAEELNADDDHYFEIEFEKLYKRFFQSGKKKRYSGKIVWKEGKHVDTVDIVGYESQRSDQSPITVETQSEVLRMIVEDEDEDEIRDYINNIVTDVKNGDVSYDEIGIPGGIGKNFEDYDTLTAHVRGAYYANLWLGLNLGKASKPKRLYLDRVHPDFFDRVDPDITDDTEKAAREEQLANQFKREQDVISYEYEDQIPDEFQVDWEKMLKKTLKGQISRVISALGIQWDEVESGNNQQGLGDFM